MIGATLISIAGATAIGLIEVVVPLDLDDRLGLSAAAIGLMFAAVAGVDAIAAPLAGRQGDRRGRRPVAITGLAVTALAAVPLALGDGVVIGGVGLLMFAGGTAIAFAAAVPWLDDAFGGMDRGLAYGGLNVLYALGYAAGTPDRRRPAGHGRCRSRLRRPSRRDGRSHHPRVALATARWLT